MRPNNGARFVLSGEGTNNGVNNSNNGLIIVLIILPAPSPRKGDFNNEGELLKREKMIALSCGED